MNSYITICPVASTIYMSGIDMTFFEMQRLLDKLMYSNIKLKISKFFKLTKTSDELMKEIDNLKTEIKYIITKEKEDE